MGTTYYLDFNNASPGDGLTQGNAFDTPASVPDGASIDDPNICYVVSGTFELTDSSAFAVNRQNYVTYLPLTAGSPVALTAYDSDPGDWFEVKIDGTANAVDVAGDTGVWCSPSSTTEGKWWFGDLDSLTDSVTAKGFDTPANFVNYSVDNVGQQQMAMWKASVEGTFQSEYVPAEAKQWAHHSSQGTYVYTGTTNDPPTHYGDVMFRDRDLLLWNEPVGVKIQGAFNFSHAATCVHIQNRNQSKTITAVGDNGSGKARFTSTAHGFVDGNNVVLSGHTDGAYNVEGQVSGVTANTFDVETITYTATDTGAAVIIADRNEISGCTTFDTRNAFKVTGGPKDGGGIANSWVEVDIVDNTVTYESNNGIKSLNYTRNCNYSRNTFDMIGLESSVAAAYVAECYATAGNDVIVEDNTCSRCAWRIHWDADGSGLYTDDGCDNVIFRRNKMTMMYRAFMTNTDCTSIIFEFNYTDGCDTFINISDSVGGGNCDGIVIANNTIKDCGYQVYGKRNDNPGIDEWIINMANVTVTGGQETIIKNNIIVGDTNANQVGVRSALGTNIDEDYNCIYNVFSDKEDSGGTIAIGTNSITTDPGLIASDNQLSSGSSNAANAGVVITGVTTNRDFEGNHRVDTAGAAPDMGCAWFIPNGPATEHL